MLVTDFKFDPAAKFGANAQGNNDIGIVLGATGDTQPISFPALKAQAWRKPVFLSSAPNLENFLQSLVNSDALFRPRNENERLFGNSRAELPWPDTLRLYIDTDWFRDQWPNYNPNRKSVRFGEIGGGAILLATLYPVPTGHAFIKIRNTGVWPEGQVQAEFSGLGQTGDVYTAQLANVLDSKNRIVGLFPAGRKLGKYVKNVGRLIVFQKPDGARGHIMDKDAIVK